MKKPTKPERIYFRECLNDFLNEDEHNIHAILERIEQIREVVIDPTEITNIVFFVDEDEYQYPVLKYEESDAHFGKRMAEYQTMLEEYNQYMLSNKSKLDKISELEKQIEDLRKELK